MLKTIVDLETFKYVCECLATRFMIHKTGEEDYHVFKDGGEYFIGDDFWIFSDGSDYYHWTLSEMYEILSKGIPYEIAAEHKDWTIDAEKRPEGWVNLEYYAMKRKGNATMEPKEFWRILTREYHYDRACRLEDSYVAETERQMKEMKDKFIKENFPGS